MLSGLWHTFFYNPIYNALIFFIDYAPNADVGVSIIFVIVIVKLILFPLSKKAVRTQLVMKRIDPQVAEIREKYKNDKQQQGQKILELYRENNVNPLSSFGLLFIQLPIVLALYFVFYRGGLPDINADILYSFVSVPDVVNMNFIGHIDMAGKSILLALAAGITQYFQISLTLPKIKDRKDDATFKDDLARSFQLQMKYVMPVFVTFIAYVVSAAVALYWLSSNIFAIGQELVIRKQVREKFHEE